VGGRLLGLFPHPSPKLAGAPAVPGLEEPRQVVFVGETDAGRDFAQGEAGFRKQAKGRIEANRTDVFHGRDPGSRPKLPNQMKLILSARFGQHIQTHRVRHMFAYVPPDHVHDFRRRANDQSKQFPRQQPRRKLPVRVVSGVVWEALRIEPARQFQDPALPVPNQVRYIPGAGRPRELDAIELEHHGTMLPLRVKLARVIEKEFTSLANVGFSANDRTLRTANDDNNFTEWVGMWPGMPFRATAPAFRGDKLRRFRETQVNF